MSKSNQNKDSHDLMQEKQVISDEHSQLKEQKFGKSGTKRSSLENIDEKQKITTSNNSTDTKSISSNEAKEKKDDKNKEALFENNEKENEKEEREQTEEEKAESDSKGSELKESSKPVTTESNQQIHSKQKLTLRKKQHEKQKQSEDNVKQITSDQENDDEKQDKESDSLKLPGGSEKTKSVKKDDSNVLNCVFLLVVCLVVLFMLIAAFSIWYTSPSRTKPLQNTSNQNKSLKPLIMIEFEPHLGCYKDSILDYLNDELSYVARFFEKHRSANTAKIMIYVVQALSVNSEKKLMEEIIPKRKAEGFSTIFLLNIKFNPRGWKSKTKEIFELACSADTGMIHEHLPFNEQSIDEFGKILHDTLHPNLMLENQK
jgi:hypothetical protein